MVYLEVLVPREIEERLVAMEKQDIGDGPDSGVAQVQQVPKENADQ